MNFRNRFSQFMQGRYGMDSFTRFLLVLSMACLILSSLFQSTIFSIACWGLLIYMYFRVFSRNITARYAEEQKYIRIKEDVKAYIRRDKSVIDADKAHRIYRCPQCRQKIRVPRGKGRIEITCPKCSRKFIKRT